MRRHHGDVLAAAERNAHQLWDAGEPDDGDLAAFDKRTFQIGADRFPIVSRMRS